MKRLVCLVCLATLTRAALSQTPAPVAVVTPPVTAITPGVVTVTIPATNTPALWAVVSSFVVRSNTLAGCHVIGGGFLILPNGDTRVTLRTMPDGK